MAHTGSIALSSVDNTHVRCASTLDCVSTVDSKKSLRCINWAYRLFAVNWGGHPYVHQ